MTTRRGFFGALAGVGAAAVGLRPARPAPVDPMALQLDELRRLSAELAKPRTATITLTLTIDGEAVSRQVLKDLPRIARQQGWSS